MGYNSYSALDSKEKVDGDHNYSTAKSYCFGHKGPKFIEIAVLICLEGNSSVVES